MNRPTKQRSPWPYGIAIGLGLVVVVNGAMIAIASRHAPVLESTQYYLESLEYETVLKAHRDSAALGYTAQLEATKTQLIWTVKDAHDAPVTGLKGTLSLRRSDSTADDAKLTVKASAPGIYSVARPPQTGLFRVNLRLEGTTAPFLAEQKLVLK